ncbi:MAG TPA: flagellar biosynthesis anti-sigma factor FlgM [Vicinamibacterales bacterium]|nr:flagellar biosynthesis anti-sigma factor FlgM [Vicinamibacterales bacterium]
MKIEGNRPTHETESLTRADAKKGQQPAPNRAADAGDRVDVSADAKKAQGLVADAVKAAQALPDVRAEAVARAKARLESGELGADAGKLADAIIDDLLK